MAINRTIWSRLASKDNFPSLPCPHCANGKLKLNKNGLRILTPKYHTDDDWDAFETNARWSAELHCDETVCGEIVHIIGDSELVETEVEVSKGDFTWGVEEVLRIQAVFPAPLLFRVSDNVPRMVKQQLQIASQMYWTDVSACVARLRTAVEALLDHQKVPKEKKTNNGKILRMKLKERIEAFTNGINHQDQLHGLRNIGNLGTHGTSDVTDEDLFDTIDVLEFVLTGIYDTQTINAKAKKLEAKKPGP
jgi:hypothetical protein